MNQPIQPEFFQFLRELRENNRTDWFHANKARYDREVKQPFLELVRQLVDALTPFEPELAQLPPAKLVHRQNRDTRFSADKRPYKENLFASISPKGTKDKTFPGFYVHLSPTEVWFAGGIYFFADKAQLHAVRQYLVAHRETWQQLVDAAPFRNHWNQVLGETQKRLPPDLNAQVASLPAVAQTQFYWMAQVPPADVLSPRFVDLAKAHYQSARPLTLFLRSAIATAPVPEGGFR